MKKTSVILLLSIVVSVTLGGCFGKFSLTRKVYQANSEVNDKIGRTLVTWAFVIVPVYGVSALLDFAIFNTIEFWSGRNPVAQGEKEFEYAEGGEIFRIHAKKYDTTILYTFERYAGARHLDSQAVEWNMTTGAATPFPGAGDGIAGFPASPVVGGPVARETVTACRLGS